MTWVMSRPTAFVQNVPMEPLSREIKNELRILMEFVELYCRDGHKGCEKKKTVIDGVDTKGPHLCAECSELIGYAARRRVNCPLDPKPACRKCHVHCYRKDFRDRIREVMAYSGRRMILRGRLAYMGHFLF